MCTNWITGTSAHGDSAILDRIVSIDEKTARRILGEPFGSGAGIG